jgi:dipeptidyl aminopeptidase/acylaminoacyl peptidase
LWDDARINVWKAADADVWLYTRETATDFPDYYAANAAMAPGARITRANPQQEEFAWTAGARLIEYQAGDAARLQAALHLPAGYEEGRIYPAVVVLGDSLSRELHRYSAPTYAGEFSASVYTNRGFAVLLPDIRNRANEPALSALESVSAAVEAAVAAGVVDANRVGLYGRGWGGYQVAATVTQSGKFAAAVAAAPVTNLVSMFGTIFWREKSGDAALRRAVRSRLTAAFWDSSAAYVRNSPVFHAAGARTPLLILHNPADSVVDFNQSADFHGTLKRLGRPAVLLQYPGEGHTLQRLENQMEAATRVREFLEHFLMDGVEPGWWRGG